MTIETSKTHPSFLRADKLAEPLRSHFPKSMEEAQAFIPLQRYRPLSTRVLVAAQTRVECTWAAYCDAVDGDDYDREMLEVLHTGVKLQEEVARALFPEFDQVPYAY